LTCKRDGHCIQIVIEQIRVGVQRDLRRLAPERASKTGLLVDSSEVISAIGNLEVAVDFSTFFSSDGVAICATWRHRHGIPRPEHIGKFAVA
jgi:hypothetical protein